MSQVFTLHDAEKCELCNGIMIEIGINQFKCPSCNNSEDGF